MACGLLAAALLAVAICASAQGSPGAQLHAQIIAALASPGKADVASLLLSRATVLNELVSTGVDADLVAAFELSASLGPTLRSKVAETLGEEAVASLLERRE